ncbi:energy-coupling factor ABC transporter ATP-binding protein [Thiocapsa roseopersicina]|uniref:ABC transporter ATP-binding protein n=1 Tax=Thiocapsa roseopersicina TaxID=1058 RepID=A0A1H2RZ70_THIRO|nr:ATP-binding cassette domain-containing protein [Thiocapsa roseopersicina]SDW23929.1 cobalt/nickel transport system ATP-binding protein [Thiocapsa roseopersicina]
MSAPILEAEDLRYDYPGGAAALQGLDLRVERGRRLALLGANGCGKTTLLLHLNGTLRPRAGALRLDGRPASYDRRALADWRGRVGLVLQEPDDQLFSATVYQDVSFGPLNQGLSASRAHVRVMEALSAMDISHLAERPTHLLSFGQKKRAAIAGVLAMGPELLILDEPDAGLDGQGIVQLRRALDALQVQGATLVFATHDVDLAYAWADEVAILVDGRLLRQGDPAEILGDPELLAAAGLAMPVLLRLAGALCRTQSWPEGRAPRTAEALIVLLSDQAAEAERLRI